MLSDINDHVRHQIDDAVIELRKLCTPYVEHIVPLHNWLDSVGKTLNATPPLLNVFVLGPPKSGKSTLLNALLGSALLPVTDAEDAEQFAPLEIVHMPGMQPLLKKAATGQHLAVTPSEIHHWLVEENKKWKAGAKPPHVFPMRLEVEVPVFGSAPFAETILNLVEGNSASVLSKTTQTPRSSLYSIVHTSLHADVVFYCIPYPHLKTDAEPVIFKALSDQLNPNVVPMLNERLFFVVTQIDEVLAAEHKIPNIHTLDKDPKFSSLEECRVYASNLIAKEFKFRVRPNQLALCSAHHALSSRIIRCQDPRPTVRQLYDYSELVHGSHYMQTIDDTPEAVLREACVNHSFVSEQNSGIKEVEDMLRIIDANSGRMLLCSAVTSALLHAQPYCSVLEQAIPLLQEETTRKADEHQALLDELDFVKRHLQTAVAELWLTIKEMRQGVADSWQEFWIMRLEELEAVLDGRDLFQFKDRQGTTIYELKRTVGRFDEFLPRYVRDRCYVEQRSREMGDAAPSGGSAFVHQNLAPILTVRRAVSLLLNPPSGSRARAVAADHGRGLVTGPPRQRRIRVLVPPHGGVAAAPQTGTRRAHLAGRRGAHQAHGAIHEGALRHRRVHRPRGQRPRPAIVRPALHKQRAARPARARDGPGGAAQRRARDRAAAQHPAPLVAAVCEPGEVVGLRAIRRGPAAQSRL
eukprot:TRINITY_DN18217_c0_g1_i2.p1 TRINITY_DN18217_c0_g1~~TRINITY_DN18217_c0_g1_i2.p1  ORF type:complete len:705 (-),score=114.52 TRINITY_DN18217_c0_g1_i2:268-2346(-)